ncbi:ABC transporter ATP-binding protein [Candidatus Kaiserbacteria bacterium]|nr:ABC transporter ATP-binding protein [Candidatus Kaiserbacteria bacterium]
MIVTRNLVRTYVKGDVVTPVLKGIDFEAQEGEFVAIMGRSGAGKSTFLYQMSLLDDPTSGEIVIGGHDTHHMSAQQKMKFRLEKFGYVFQDYALLPDLTAIENVALPLLMQGLDRIEAYTKAGDSLGRINLGHRLYSLPSQLSGGEQQRVSIARAVAHSPKILFADEPTANLDNISSRAVMDIFLDLHKQGQTIIMVTHEEEYAKLAQKLIHLDDGKVISSVQHPTMRDVKDAEKPI